MLLHGVRPESPRLPNGRYASASRLGRTPSTGARAAQVGGRKHARPRCRCPWSTPRGCISAPRPPRIPPASAISRRRDGDGSSRLKLLEVERPGQAHCRPQGRTRTRSPQPLPVAIRLWTAAPGRRQGGATQAIAGRQRIAALLGEISGHHLPDGLFKVVHGGPKAGEAVAGCAEVPWRTANRRAIMVGSATISWPGWWHAVTGWPRMTGPLGHNGRTRVLRRYADDHRRDPVAVGDGRTGVPHPEDPRSPGTATPPRRRAGESLNLLSRDRTSDGHASIYCGNASCGRERAQIMVLL